MNESRDDKPGYIFCNAETKEELAKRAGADIPPGNVFVVADIIPFGYCVVATKDEFLGWLFAKGNDHDVWTIPKEENDDPNETV